MSNHCSNTEPYIVEDPDSNQRCGFPPASVYANHLCGPPPYVPPPKVNQWSLEDDEMKFGPFSDGEAETIKRLPRLSRRGGHPHGRSQHPHYATMSRRLEGRDDHVGRLRGGPRYSSQPQLNQSRDRSDTAIPGILSPFSMKTSITLPRRLDSKLSNGYPDLARHPLSYSSVPPTFSTLPVPNPYSSSSPQPYSSTPEPYNPQPFNTTTNNSVQIERTQSLDSEYHPSRSSSVGEIDLGDKGSNPPGSWRIRTNENQWDGELEYQNWNNSQIPQLSRINGHGRNQSWDPDSGWPEVKGEEWLENRNQNGRRESSTWQDGRCEPSTRQENRISQSHWVDGDGQDWIEHEDRTESCRNTLQRSGNLKRPRSGAVKVDLSWADTRILLFSADEPMMNGGGGSSVKKSSSTKNRRKSADRTSRARSTSSDRTARTPCRKPGVSPGGRKQVVFAGLEDNSSTSSEDKNSKESLNSENEVWVKRSDKSGLDDDDDDIPVTGVVIAKPSACQFYQNAQK
ncbi:uncharacterized protein LOC111715389 [Eurytemora carolleeae]|uniref:uncharacterized protein LOC111715389 n=1 Tax=Eurytemora carolleeae TaxID=1294199 RepID=UPI000C75FFD7|nr:uncharacterized protein LOC111715389 [Eurytemora carolleeae]|eukprot:XP_023346468.1 uncharacterized protein LOC111715389 [Eurytemora affinis]